MQAHTRRRSHENPGRPRRVRYGICGVTLAMLVAAGCSSGSGAGSANTANQSGPAQTAPQSQQLTADGIGQQAGRADVPWSKVGPGWVLAMWSRVPGHHSGQPPAPGQPTAENSPTTLYLVDPAGSRYAIADFAAPGDSPGMQLADWSGDGSRALFYSAGPDSWEIVSLDLHTGTQTSFTLPADDMTLTYTHPTGAAVLVAYANNGNRAPSLTRFDLSGHQQLTYPTAQLKAPYTGGDLATPDGTRLVLGTSTGVAVMGNDGKVLSYLPVPGQSTCQPLRWWDGKSTQTALVKCDTGGTVPTSALWLVPLNGDIPSRLTAPNDGQHDPDYANLNAWHLPSGTFVQAAGACGYQYLAKLDQHGTTSPVRVPQADHGSSVLVVGVNGDSLDLRATVACGTGQALLNYNPAKNTSTVLLGASVNGGGVLAAVPYPGQQ